MNLIKRTAYALGRVFRSNPQLGSLPGAIAQWFGDHDGGLNASGEAINYRTALHITTVYTCVKVIAESVASLPLLLMEEVGNGHEEATDQRLHYLLSVEPNPNMSAPSLIEAMCVSLCLAGNAYVEIERNGAGQPIALWPLHPRHTEPIQKADGSLIYETRDGASGAKRYILKEDILHVPLFSFDGVKGLDPITLLRQSLGMAKAAERQGALFFANNSTPSGGLLINEDEMDPKSEQGFRESWEETQGAMKKGRIGVLTGKWKYQSIGLTAEQAQYLQTRAFQRTELAAIYRLSPSQVGDTTRQSNSNKVQENLSFVVDTLRPYLTRIEIEIRRKLLPQVGRKAGKYIARFDISERLRGDFLTTQQGYALGRQWGYYSGNDIRRAEGMNIGGPELDVYWYPLNMGNAKNLLGDGETTVNLEQVKSSIRHLIPQWTAAFNTAGELNVRDLTLFKNAFAPVYTAIFDAFNGDPEVDASVFVDPVIRSLYRRSETWPAIKEPEFDEIAMLELTRSAQQLHEQMTRKKAA